MTKNVLQIISQADPVAVARCYVSCYDKEGSSDGYGTPAKFSQFQDALSKVVRVDDGSGMRAIITVRKGYYDVSGETPGTNESWALDFTSWQEWCVMPVEDRTGENLTLDQMAAHLYYEMTWHGWPSEMESRRDDLMDAVEDLKRSLGEEDE